MGYHQAYHHMNNGNLRRKRETERGGNNMWKYNGPEMLQIWKRHETTHARSSINSKKDQFKDIHTDTL